MFIALLMLVLTGASAVQDDGRTVHRYEYDGADNLLAEWQQHFGNVDGDSAVINYTWDFRSAIDASGAYDPNGNYNRPVDMTYPTRGGSEVAVEFSYGDGSGDVDHALSRITDISADYDDAEYSVQYHYAGLGRRVAREYGNNGVIQSFGDGYGYPGLDRFGRVIDLHFQKPSANQPHRARYQYGYDKAGNRTHVRTWQPVLGAPEYHDNDRSYLYQYDALNRLIAADLGRLNATDDAIEESDPIPWRTDWLLDNLGNWSGGDAASGSLIETGVYGQTDPDRTTHHATNYANEIDAIDLDGGSGGGGETTTFVHDAVGNLVFDAVYWYQYDGWNRLVQVNEAGTLTDADFDADTGFLIPPNPNDPNDPDGVPGDPVARFVYDGLGRLMFYSTHLDYSTPIDEHVNHHLYYDGVRRVTGAAATAGAGAMGFAQRIAALLNFRSFMTDMYLRVSTSAGQAASSLERLYRGVAQTVRAPSWPGPYQGRQVIDGITFSVEALGRMMPSIGYGARGVPPSAVLNAIRYGTKVPSTKHGSDVFLFIYENVTVAYNVVTDVVITVWKTGH